MATWTGAYVVDALEEAERVDFERHLADCPQCQAEVDELRGTAAELGLLVAEAPPADLKRRVLAEVARTRQVGPAGSTRFGRRQRPARNRSRPSRATLLAAAAAVVAIAVAGVFGVEARRAHQELDRTREQMAQAESRGNSMSQVVQASDARMAGFSAAGGRITVVSSQRDEKALFMGSGMRAAPDQRTYQLWFMTPAGPTSAGILSRDAGGDMTPLVANMPAVTQKVAITVEPAGGSPQPTSNPLSVLNMPA